MLVNELPNEMIQYKKGTGLRLLGYYKWFLSNHLVIIATTL